MSEHLVVVSMGVASHDALVRAIPDDVGATVARLQLGDHWWRNRMDPPAVVVAPVVSVQPDDVWSGRVDASAAEAVVEQHLVAGQPADSRRLTRSPGGVCDG